MTTNRVFVTGDHSTSRHMLSDLTGGTSIGRVSNGLCSDIGSGLAYVLAHNGAEISGTSNTVSQLIQIDSQTGALTSTIIPLSASFVTGTGGNGLFSGNGRVVVYNGERVFDILLPSGVVTDLGPMSVPSWEASENWAIWGVAEFFSGRLHLAYRAAAGHTIVRRRVPDGQEQAIATFSNLGDMASWTVSRLNGRWYFHHENSSQFGGIAETLGYAPATFETGPHTQPPVISSPQDASGFVGSPFSYQIQASRSPLSYSATGLPAGLSLDTGTGLISGTPTTAGTYAASISATNWVGTTTVALTLIVHTQFPTVALFANTSYVNTASLAQMQASLTGIGSTVTTFTGLTAADWNAAFSSSQVVVVPSLLSFSPSSVLYQTINQNLAAGKGLVLAGGGWDEQFLNALRGWRLSEAASIYSLALSKSEGLREFVNSPTTLLARTGVFFCHESTLPDASAQIYENGTYVGVWSFGRIGSLGYSWAGGPDAAWDLVLKDMINAVRGYVSAPEISVRLGFGSDLTDGSAGASDFGSTGIGSSRSFSFSISNAGFADLTGLDATIDGVHAADFSITATPAASVASMASTSFTVQFTPSATGVRTAKLRISSNDANENPFDILIRGTGFVPAPEIGVEAYGQPLFDGASSVTFRSAPVTGYSNSFLFIENTGTGSLTGVNVTIDGNNAADFTVMVPPPSSLPPYSYGSEAFTVRFKPSATGVRSAQLHIASNDADENPFDVTLTGTGLPLVGTASLFTDATFTIGSDDDGPKNEIRSALSDLGYAVTDFTGTSAEAWDGAFDTGVVVVPPLNLNLLLPGNTLTLINNHLDGGKGLVVLGSPYGRASSFLNSIRGWSLYEEDWYFQQAHTPMSKTTGLSGFAASPAELTSYEWIYNIIVPSLPFGAQVPYFEFPYAPVFTHQHAAFMGYQWQWGTSPEAFAVLQDLMAEVRQPAAGPEIGVAQSSPNHWVSDGDGPLPARQAVLGSQTTTSYVIRNFGKQPLSISGVQITGVHLADFTVSTSPAVMVAPGTTTSLAVRFAPSSLGSRSAILQIVSNDGDETSFDVALTGTGITTLEAFDAWLPATLPDRAAQGTPHHDGIANLLKYAFNLDANAPDHRVMAPGGTSGLPVIGRQQAGASTVFRFEFMRRIGSGLDYIPEKNSTLNSGGWAPLLSSPVITPVNEFWERVIYEEPVDMLNMPACFGRVRVLLP